MLTEDEAKRKWCPSARAIPARLDDDGMIAVPAGVPAHNRVQERGETEATWHAAHNCLASVCMAWRWTHSSAEVGGVKRIDHEDTRPLGYCGLAGPVESSFRRNP